MKKTLYKYCSISTPQQYERTIKILKGKLFFSSPKNFNDPFELSAKVNISTSPLLLNLNSREVKEVHRVFRVAQPEAVSDEWKEKIGILCLSETPQQILMWSHYGANHTGVCIGFDSGDLPFKSALKVHYSDERPFIQFDSSPKNLLERVLLTKSSHWSHEQEWRIIKRKIEEDELKFYYDHFKSGNACLDEIAEIIENNDGPGLYNFDPSSIRSIFLGAKINKEHQEEIISIAREPTPQAKIFSVELDGRYYWLNKKKIK